MLPDRTLLNVGRLSSRGTIWQNAHAAILDGNVTLDPATDSMPATTFTPSVKRQQLKPAADRTSADQNNTTSSPKHERIGDTPGHTGTIRQPARLKLSVSPSLCEVSKALRKRCLQAFYEVSCSLYERDVLKPLMKCFQASIMRRFQASMRYL